MTGGKQSPRDVDGDQRRGPHAVDNEKIAHNCHGVNSFAESRAADLYHLTSEQWEAIFPSLRRCGV